MRIVLDMQGAQSESRYRGIGRYTLSFAQAIVKNRGEHEIILALSGLFPESIAEIRNAFAGLLPQENIRVWYAPGPVSELDQTNQSRRENAELIREAFLASLQADIIHVFSLFEGYVDDAVTSIGRFDRSTTVSATIFDLIPLLNPEKYLEPNPAYEKYYRNKLEHLQKAKLLVAISESAKHEVMTHLPDFQGKLVNAYLAADSIFKTKDYTETEIHTIRSALGIHKPFVLYTGGVDERKNLFNLIEAYSLLPLSLRSEHQLVFAGRIPHENEQQLRKAATKNGLEENEIIFTAYISDAYLCALYNLCALFVFPSLHEGFGLPVLEAMNCGAAVIASNTSSLPEVMDIDDALFDPLDITSIAKKIEQGLTEPEFQKTIKRRSQKQCDKFSWNSSAQTILEAWEAVYAETLESLENTPTLQKSRLAFVTPLPPTRSGIADYSAELIPALAEYYDITIISDQREFTDDWIKSNCNIQPPSWLKNNICHIDKVIYQLGNSPFHDFMLPLIDEIPGIVVMHDFYLSSLFSWKEIHNGETGCWINDLYIAHGYRALVERLKDTEKAKYTYPSNLRVLQSAKGVIIHSNYAIQLARQWYLEELSQAWKKIPLLRAPIKSNDKTLSRKNLGLDEESLIICSFGFVDPTKLNHRLLNAFVRSKSGKDQNCHLFFVGHGHEGDYGKDILKTIKEHDLSKRVHITGFVSPDEFHDYLAAADIAVQLRTDSRGETSASVLDCMNYGLPVIVNANGSMAELDPEAVYLLDDDFDDDDLLSALEELYNSSNKRKSLGEKSRKIVNLEHRPEKCAKAYYDFIEESTKTSESDLNALICKISENRALDFSKHELRQLSSDLALTLPLPQGQKRLLLDITATHNSDLKTGIERVARALTLALINSPPHGYRIEPVYLKEKKGAWEYHYAREYTLELLGCSQRALHDELVEFHHHDLLLTLDFSGDSLIKANNNGLFTFIRNHGVKVYSVLFDLLPINFPEYFLQPVIDTYSEWIQSVSNFDGLICISESVAKDYEMWRSRQATISQRDVFTIDWFHLGADIKNSQPSKGLPSQANEVLHKLKSGINFLMVGTIEPRKGHKQVLQAFEQLWEQGAHHKLVIVGKQGWKTEDLIKHIRNHPQLNQKLFWLEGISDEFLEKLYEHSTCLIAASYAEGFGLPLIEAAQYSIPIIARDIPVFREVAGDCSYFFPDTDNPNDIALGIADWIALYQNNEHPKSDALPWLTWEKSASELARTLLKESL